MTSAVVFDFDGVILESADIKTNAFRRLFDGDERAVAHHLAHVGVSRYEKFRFITTEIFGQPYTEADEQRLGHRFGELVFDEMLTVPFVPGAQELLERRAGELPLFVASGTPEDELREIVQARGLDGRFAGVYGSPATKAEILRRVLADLGVQPKEVVMVGDATTDLVGAREAAVRFVGRVGAGRQNPFDGAGIPVVEDLGELDRRWPELCG